MRRANDPILTYRFVLELGFLEVGGFSECSGLTLETRTIEYREGGRNGSVLKFPDIGAVGNVTLKRGVIQDATLNTLLEWQMNVMRGQFDPNRTPNTRDPSPDKDLEKRCAILVQDERGTMIRRFTLVRAFPVKWTGPELKAAASDVAIESLELACEGVTLS